jgi:3-oxoacyl-(acyl-carrier-protein) synthase
MKTVRAEHKEDQSLVTRVGEAQNRPISITSISAISPLGVSLEEAWQGYRDPRHLFVQKRIINTETWMAPLSDASKKEVRTLRETPMYRNLDDTVLYAIIASRKAVKEAGWKQGDNFGINIGSSRGATALFEKYHEEFIQNKSTSPLSSPTTTLGNISSWVAQDLQTLGPEISHSITCTTALHSLLNGMAWIKSGMADKFLVGGSEAPLTPFTISQMKAMKIYSNYVLNAKLGSGQDYPCRALDLKKTKNTLVLGEGASVACLEGGRRPNALAEIIGVGYATEILEHGASLSAEATCFQRSMAMALGKINPAEVDVIVMHAPGTIKGDRSEYKAIQKVFSSNLPALTTNKWKFGHTFGASGMLNVEMAVLMMRHQKFIEVPFIINNIRPTKIHQVLVNAVGFGGNAVSILLKAPNR